MDLYNNSIGIEIGGNNKQATNAEMAQLLVAKLNAGELKILSNLTPGKNLTSNSEVVWSINCN